MDMNKDDFTQVTEDDFFIMSVDHAMHLIGADNEDGCNVRCVVERMIKMGYETNLNEYGEVDDYEG